MADKKVTIMVIKVDLGCEKCKKKIKKILCGIPQIQNQIYDEKTNTVTVTVVCCSPEKIKKKICCKGGDSVKGIEIKEPEKPKPPPPDKPKEPEKPKEKPTEPEKPKENPKEPENKPKEPEKPKEKPKEPEKPKEKPKVVIVEPPNEVAKPKPPEPAPKALEPAPKPPAPAPAPDPAPVPKAPEPIPAYPPEPVPAYPPEPVRTCCPECYHGYGGGPCFQGFGSTAPYGYEGYGTPRPCYEAYGRPVYDSWGAGGGSVYYVGRSDCISEENPSACSVM